MYRITDMSRIKTKKLHKREVFTFRYEAEIKTIRYLLTWIYVSPKQLPGQGRSDLNYVINWLYCILANITKYTCLKISWAGTNKDNFVGGSKKKKFQNISQFWTAVTRWEKFTEITENADTSTFVKKKKGNVSLGQF